MLTKVKDLIKRNYKIAAVSLIIGFFVTATAVFAEKSAYDEIVRGISGQVIRFHVLANSDSENDQALKLKVRDRVLERFKDRMNSCSDVEETRRLLAGGLTEIEAVAKDVIRDEGYDYSVAAGLSKSVFPDREYGGIYFPAGEYEALRIVIGEGKGQNWWCVMFPPLCFVDVTHKQISDETKETLKNVLSEDEYKIVVDANSEEVIPVRVRFKILEWLKNRW